MFDICFICSEMLPFFNLIIILNLLSKDKKKTPQN